MKLLTVAIPSYNSEEYLERAVNSLLGMGEDIEVLIINDGSTDRTAEIADRYEKQYPEIVKAVHKENGGHGSGVNVGLSLAKGLYFKVLDSDDWFDKEALRKVLKTLRYFSGENRDVFTREPLDCLICNYV